MRVCEFILVCAFGRLYDSYRVVVVNLHTGRGGYGTTDGCDGSSEGFLALARDGVEDDPPTHGETTPRLLDDLLQMSAMPTNEDSVGLRQWIKIGTKKVAPAEGNARSVMTTRIGVEKLGALGTYLEGDHL